VISQDGNTTPNWRRNEKSGCQQYTEQVKQVDRTSSLAQTDRPSATFWNPPSFLWPACLPAELPGGPDPYACLRLKKVSVHAFAASSEFQTQRSPKRESSKRVSYAIWSETYCLNKRRHFSLQSLTWKLWIVTHGRKRLWSGTELGAIEFSSVLHAETQTNAKKYTARSTCIFQVTNHHQNLCCDLPSTLK